MGSPQSRSRSNSKSRAIEEAVIIKNPSFASRNIFEFKHAKFDSDFEGGNLVDVIRTGDHQFDLFIANDNEKLGKPYETTNKAWFYFKIKDITFINEKSHDYRFTITNRSTNKNNQLRDSFKPVYRTKKNKQWNYVPGELISHKLDRESCDLTFECTIHENDEIVSLAYSFPYTHKKLGRFIDNIQTTCMSNSLIYFHKEVVTHSLDGMKIELLTITGNTPEFILETVEEVIPGLFPVVVNETIIERPKMFNKKYVFLSARCHPGETPGSYMLESFIKSLIDPDNVIGKTLLNHFVFVIIPMINPDGVVRGHYRTDTKGKDLNRCYNSKDLSELPGVKAVIKVAESLAKNKRLFAYIDFHAHNNKDSAFLLANHDQNFENRKKIRKFLRLYDIYSENFDYASCNVLNKVGNLNISKQKIGIETKCPLAFTLEVNYHNSKKDRSRYNVGNQLPSFKQEIEESINHRLTPESYREVGRSLGDVLLEMIGLHPNSKLNQTCFNNVHEFDNFIEKEVLFWDKNESYASESD